MRRTVFGLSLAAFLVIGWLNPPTAAQETKSARGTVSALGADSITVKTADRELKFVVDAKTVLTASGAGTAERQAAAAGKPGLRLSDFVKAGEAVEVSYLESAGTMRATNVRRISSAGGGSMTPEAQAETANGTVDSIAGMTLTISGSAGGGGTFKQSYSVDATTKVIALGAGTAAESKGGKINLTDFVGVGDQVTVTYRKVGAALHADEVRVRAKKK